MSALKGIRIIDLSRHAPGPYCTMLMADLGADVVVVEERPGTGRSVADELGVSQRAKAFNPVGRNKRSIALNLKDPAQRDACLRLMDGADVVVEGFRPGVAKRLGVDYETVRVRNPRAVYCSITGYGQDGPYAQYPGHDLNYISLSGVLGMVGSPGGAPVIPPNVIGDFAGGGLFAAFSVLAGVISARQTGRGQYIDMAMTDGALSLTNLAASETFETGRAPRPGEYFLLGSLPCYNVYETSDGKWLGLGCMEPWFWKNLCAHLGCEEFIASQFDAKQFTAQFEFLRACFKEKDRDTWFAELREEQICITPIYAMDEVDSDPHLQARQMFVDIEDPEFGRVRQVGVAPKFSETPGEVHSVAPQVGAHSEEVLREAGYSATEIAEILVDK